MSSTNNTRLSVAIQSLNKIFWLASIGLWLMIVGRSGIWSEDVTLQVFWINFLMFLAAGLGTAATTHFAASALPLWFGVMAVTAHDFKGGVVWVSLYVMAAIAIGFFAGIIKLIAFWTDRRAASTGKDS